MFFLNLTNNSWTENKENTTKTLVWISPSVFANFRFQLNFCKKRLSQVFFFFQLLTATCENSSTRLEKRLENSKSVKWFIEKIAPQSGGILQKFVCWGSRSTACEIPGRACLHGGGGPQIGEVTCGGSPCLSCKRDQIKMIDYMDRWVTHQSRLPHLPGVPQLHVNRP